MPRIFRIHPALGVARVGDSPAATFLGPEIPGVPANWNFATNSFDSFKDGGQIKRQGVRFRVFEFNPDGSVKGESIPGQGDIVSIEWTVNIANKKASFFQFLGPKGEQGDFDEKDRRNGSYAGARTDLEINVGQKTISGPNAGPVVLTNPNPLLSGAIPDLGEIFTDEQGRLKFFGGHGRTFQLPKSDPIEDYVNNDGWFDDVGDGPVTAKITFRDGSSTAQADALAAWVTVAPPDFAPAIANVVSLYDLMWDVAVRAPASGNFKIPNLAMFRTGGTLERLQTQRDDWATTGNGFTKYSPSYVNEVMDLFIRAFNATFVHAPPPGTPFHRTLSPVIWNDLADPTKSDLRKTLFARMRDPNGQPADSDLMPRGLGDQYADESDTSPAGKAALTNSKRFFSLTQTQYAMLRQWSQDIFDGLGSSGLPPQTIPPATTPITPEGLDRAVLENCVGGPFFPGIEVSWLIRNPAVYSEPFRINLGATVGNLVIGPGFFTQQMALPWQADFRDCAREPLTNPKTGAPTFAMWWAGQRPDDVYPEGAPEAQVPWIRAPNFTVISDTDKAQDDGGVRYAEMIKFWTTLGFVAKRIGAKWVETERNS